MRNTFLKSIQQRILENDVPLENQIVVLPTRRAASFLKKSLTETLTATSWLPEFTTFNTWMEDISGLRSVDALHLKFACYDAYREVMGASAQDVSGFFSWVDVLLADFNDIEAYMVEPSTIFRELKDYTDIAHFSFLQDPLSVKQLNYQRFWRALPKIHEALNRTLLEKGLGYPGLIARQAVAAWDGWIAAQGAFFVTIGGFNALSTAEAALLAKAQNSGHAAILFDTDAYYLRQKANHAGIFLRKNIAQKVGQNIFTPLSLEERPIHIFSGESSSRAAQAAMVAGIISSIPEGDLSDTALVLADERLLIPLLNRLPESVKSSNITMGIGLGDTIFTDWLSSIWECHEAGNYVEGQFHFSAEHLQRLLGHPVSMLLDTWSGQKNTRVLDLTLQANFIAAHDLTKAATEAGADWLKPLLEPWNHSSTSAAKWVEGALDEIEFLLRRRPSAGYEARILGESVMLVQRALKKMQAINEFGDLRAALMLNLLLRELNGASLALLGEPLQGLQIMGLLETRALAFKNILICSVNEDILPHKARIDSFIPFEIRHYHHLPGKREKEAVYAYHFYRLLQHAENAYLIFSTDTQDQRGNEKSRYLQQITSELATVNPHLTLTQIGLTNKQKEIPESKLEILKSPDVVQRIREVIETKLSASSINRYLDSPLEWYYAYVLKLEDKTPSAELDPATFGSLVHEALNNLKKPFINQELTEAMVDQMIGGAKAELQRQFESNPLSRQYAIGLNHVHFKVATRLVKRFLKSEKTCIAAGESIVYLASEQKLGRKLTVQREGEQITAVFTGSADSVERRNGELRMVDYKTGKVSSADMALGSFEMDTIAKKPKVLQLLLYSWMGQLEYPGENIHGQIISMPTPAVRSIAPKVGINDPDGRASFEELLATIVRHMLDSNEQISANEDFKYAVFE